MESIKDFKRKYNTLYIFFRGIPQMPIGWGKAKVDKNGDYKADGYEVCQSYDLPPYEFRDQYRKKFDAILHQAEDYYLSCMVDEIELEDEIMANVNLIPSIRKSINEGEYNKYYTVSPRDCPWLKSLLKAEIISNLEFNLACNHIRYCAETMQSNVQKLGKILQRYSEKDGNNKEASFNNIIQYPDKEKLLKRLHALIDGNGGALVGSIIMKAKFEGYLMQYPTQAQFKSEFELIGTWQSVSNYFNENSEKALDKANKIVIFEA